MIVKQHLPKRRQSVYQGTVLVIHLYDDLPFTVEIVNGDRYEIRNVKDKLSMKYVGKS